MTDPAPLRPTMVPVHLSLGRGTVELVDMAGEAFRAPFLAHTDIEHREHRPPSARGWAPLEEYLAVAEPTGVDPCGLIFSTGRSGSTLLCNMLGEVEGLLVMKEAQPVGEVVHAIAQNEHGAPGEPHADADAGELRELLRRVTRTLFRPTRGQQRLVVKESWLGSANCGLLADAFPATPIVFVTREVTDVVASFLGLPPPWVGELLQRPRRELAMLLPTLRGEGPAFVDVLTLYTHFWLSAQEAAAGLDPARVAVVTHEELRADPGATLARVLDHLSLAAAPGDFDRAVERSRFYAKPEPGEQPVPIEEAGDRQADLTEAMRREILALTGNAVR